MIKSPAARLLLISLGFIAFVIGTLLPGAYGMARLAKIKNYAELKKIDTNSDGQISWKELIELFPYVSEAEFDEFTNGDKELSMEEFLYFMTFNNDMVKKNHEGKMMII